MSTQTMTPDTKGDVKTRCPLYGCRRLYSDRTALESHIRDHDIPAESIPGKILLCSSIGCSDSFPDMQQLMQHMRRHHKPNLFYLCESCRAKLRSYRGLLAHLHTCSKVSRARVKTEPMEVQPASSSGEGPSRFPPHAAGESWSGERQAAAAAPLSDPAAGGSQDLSHHSQHVEHPLGGPPALDQGPRPATDSQEPRAFRQQLNLEPLQLRSADFGASPDGVVMATTDLLQFDGQARHHGHALVQSQPHQGPFQTQPQFQAQPPPEGQYGAQPQVQTQTQAPQPQSDPHAPTSSAAVWQTHPAPGDSRALSEPTRGRYKCAQCSLLCPNRKALTAHVHSEHRAPRENR